MASCFRISALLLGFLGLIIVLVTTVSNTWKISSTTTDITTNWIYEGLWMNCETNALGSVQCKKFYYLLSLDTYIHVCRTLMITSLILGMFGTLLTLFGLKNSQLGTSNENTKSTIGGIIFILAGLSSTVAVSWYAERIRAQFIDSLYGTKYELGYALYLGWAGSLLSLLGGVFLTCSCKGGKRGKQRDYRHDCSTAEEVKESCIYIEQSETA